MGVPGSRALKGVDRLRKLRAMSVDEIRTRLRYAAYCRIERGRHARGELASPERLRAGLTSDLAGASDWRAALLRARQHRSRRFFDGAEHVAAVRALVDQGYAAERATAREHAARALNREFAFFDGSFRYPDRMTWNNDPVTGAEWPRVYHRDVPADGGDVGFGDIKYVWELGRHQFVIDLAKAWAIERDPRYAAAARALAFDWRRDSPLGTGVGWCCALEPAFRALSWLWGYFLTADDPAMDADAHLQWLEGFYDHGWFLYRHLEYYTSPYNHLMGEACALYCLGVLFPEFREADKWREHGRAVLESRLGSQFYRDGGSVEQSTFYHHATTGFYLLAMLIGRANGEELSPDVRAAVERAIEFSMVMQQPDGTTPRIGGADDGKPIRMEHLPFWDFRPYQAIGAVLFERKDFKRTAERFWEDALWLLGPDGAARFDALPAATPPPVHLLPATGYVVARSGWSADADYLCFDCGEQAAGLRRDDIPSAAHGHADCLSVIVWRGGHPVLIDAGFHCYNGPKPWQDHFRETAAHNTVRVDHHDQALHINKMAWSYTYTASLEGHDLRDGLGWVVGSHDGYRRLEKGPVVHRRAVWLRERGYLVICDFLEGTGTRDVEVTFQFAPGRLCVTGDSASFDGRADLHWFAASSLTPRVHDGEPRPDGGWIAPSLGLKTRAPRLVLEGALTFPTTIVTVLTDVHPERLTVGPAADGGSNAIRVAGSGWADVIRAGEAAGTGVPGQSSEGLARAWREEGGRLVADGVLGGAVPRR